MSRFTTAWVNVAKENNLLKIIVGTLAITTITLGVTSANLATQPPLIIERECISKIASIGTNQVTQVELDSFLKDALSQRFNSGSTVSADMLALEELKSRELEQGELQKREIKQSIIVNKISKNDDGFLVDVDRLLSVGSIRSAFSYPLMVKIETGTRTVSNPYGLVLLSAKPVAQESKEKKSK